MISYSIKNRHILYAAIFLAATLLLIGTVFAQTEASLPEGVSQEQISSAVADLSTATGQDITTTEQAISVCDQEKYFEICANIGKEHNLYKPEEIRQVDSFVDEIKGKISQDLQSCQTTECLINVANELAKKLSTSNSTLATNFDLVPSVVKKKEAIVKAATDLGINFEDCHNMDPDTASIELLRTCAKLAKDTRVQTSIPENVRDYSDKYHDKMVDFKESLAKGEYQCGDGTMDGCGKYCLNPSEADRAAGTAVIPQVCKDIAVKFFGTDGVRQLESSYQKTKDARDFYYKKADNIVFTTIDGKTLNNPEDIGNYMEEQGRKGNVAAVEKGMDFMISQGFVTPKDKEYALQFVRRVGERGGIQDFDSCINNPQSCQDFVPDERRGDFEDFQRIENVMRQELGFDPRECDRGESDPSIGSRCVEGAKRALSKLETLGVQSQGAKQVLQEIRGHVARGEEFQNRKGQFQQVFQQQGGPGGCKSEGECRAYCSDPAHGPECIAFGASQGISGFRGNEAVEKYQQFNQIIQAPQLPTQYQYDIEHRGAFSGQGQGPYPGFQPPGQGGYPPPGQYPGFTQPGPGFGQPSGHGGSAGPSPECFAAIQSGDFVRAKDVCNVPQFRPQPISGSPYPISSQRTCPASSYFECPAGQYHKLRYTDECPVDQCVPFESYSPPPYPTYTPYPTFSPSGDPAIDCQKSGGKWEAAYGYCRFPQPSYSPEPYPTYSPGPTPTCPSDSYWDNYKKTCIPTGPYPSYTSAPLCPSGQWWDYTYKQCTSVKPCDPGYYWDSTNQVCKPGGGTPYPSCPSGQWWDSARNMCTSTACNTSSYWDSATNTCKPSGPTPYYTPYPSPKSCPSGQWWDSASNICRTTCPPNQYWNGNACVDNVTTSYTPYPTYSPPVTGSCPSGYHYHGESGGFCMNEREDYGGTCYDSSGKSVIRCPTQPTYTPYPSSSPTGGGSCPSGSHTMYVNNAGGYCMSDADPSKCGPLSSTSVGSFGSCSNYQTTPSYSPGPGSYSPYPSCPSGQWWNGTACTSTTTSYTPYPSISYTPYPSAQPCPSGQWWDYAYNKCTSTTTTCGTGYYWDSAANMCKPNSSTSYTPYPSYSYTPYPSATAYSGYCGDHVCGTGESVSCPSDCSVTTTSYTPYPSISYTPYPSATATYCGTGYYWDSASYMCKSTCPSTQYWNGSACVDNVTTSYTPYPTNPTITYTPYPTTEYTPPPYTYTYSQSGYSPSPLPSTVGLLNRHQLAVHCQQLSRRSNGSVCEANGLLARIYEDILANILKVFGF